MLFNDLIDNAIDDNLEHDDNKLYDDKDVQDLVLPRPPISCQTTEYLKAFHIARSTIEEQWREVVVKVLDFMKSKAMDTTLFLHHLFWNTSKIINDSWCKYERTSVTYSKELKDILHNLYCLSCKHSKGFCSQEVVATMMKIAREITLHQINCEMCALSLVLESAPLDFNEESLLSTKLETLIPLGEGCHITVMVHLLQCSLHLAADCQKY